MEGFKEYTDKLADFLEQKNKDYGNSAFILGETSILVRIHDKMMRIFNLIKNGASFEDESLRDTFWDLAGYGIIGTMYLDKESEFINNLPKLEELRDLYEYPEVW